MNAKRRKNIDRAISLLETAKRIIEAAAAEERDYYDNMPDSPKEGDKASVADEAATALEEAVDAIDELTDSLETAKGND